MSQENLSARLSALCAELDALGSADDALQPRLRELARSTQSLLNRSDEAAHLRRQSLVAHLTEAERHFEESHPTVAATVRQAIELLGNMGI